MSLATRCSACGTVFRVVQDQLKVSEGWVRCGRCNEVFNALEGLFDLDREAPPDWAPEEREEWAKQGGAARAGAPADDAAPEPVNVEDDPHLVEKIDSELFGDRAGSRGLPVPADAARSEAPMFADDGTADAVRAHGAFDGPADDEPAPDFLRKAEREERWTRPAMRWALSVISLALLGALALQAGHHFRDDLAARWPEASPIVAAWCERAGCRVGLPRHIEEIAVESTALSRSGSTDAYRLSVVLRNHGPIAQAMPSIDLALTDGAGQLIARRTLDARDFAAVSTRVPAGGETTLQTLLTAGSARITGYTVEVFYP